MNGNAKHINCMHDIATACAKMCVEIIIFGCNSEKKGYLEYLYERAPLYLNKQQTRKQVSVDQQEQQKLRI